MKTQPIYTMLCAIDQSQLATLHLKLMPTPHTQLCTGFFVCKEAAYMHIANNVLNHMLISIWVCFYSYHYSHTSSN